MASMASGPASGLCLSLPICCSCWCGLYLCRGYPFNLGGKSMTLVVVAVGLVGDWVWECSERVSFMGWLPICSIDWGDMHMGRDCLLKFGTGTQPYSFFFF